MYGDIFLNCSDGDEYPASFADREGVRKRGCQGLCPKSRHRLRDSRRKSGEYHSRAFLAKGKSDNRIWAAIFSALRASISDLAE